MSAFAQSPELQSKLAVWRAKALDGSITKEEMHEAMALMRGERTGAVKASENSRRKTARAAVPSADELMDELGLGDE